MFNKIWFVFYSKIYELKKTNFKNRYSLTHIIILLLSILGVKAQEKIIIEETNSIRLYETFISINSSDNIYPTIFEGGLIYSSAFKSNFYNFLYSDLKSEPKKIKINKKFQSGAMGVFKNEIYVTGLNKRRDSLGDYNFGIFKGNLDNFKATNLTILPICNVNYSYTDAAISKDGNSMVVITNENKRYHLLEFNKNNNNEWVKGDIIYISHPNFKILNPTIYNKNTIYFSSNINKGAIKSEEYKLIEGKLELVELNREKGVFNIYKIERKNGKWQLPVKAEVFNSEFDELGVVFKTQTTGYLTTYRFNNTDNIYYFELKEN